jgi:hypothetical protein
MRLNPNEIRGIIIHHSATPPETSYESIRESHLARGWADIGYHLVAGPGWARLGRDLEVQGAHCDAGGWNGRSIGVCLVGDYREREPERDVLEPARWGIVALFALLRRTVPVLAHREVDATLCPGPWDVTNLLWSPALRRYLAAERVV